MFVFWGAVDLNQPANWPEGTPFPQQRAVLAVHFNSSQYERNRVGINYGGIVIADETHIPNQTRCIDLFNRSAERDIYNLGKYYVRSGDGSLWERLGWVRNPTTYTPNPDNDIRIVLGRSSEFANYEDNLNLSLTRHTTMRTVPALNIATAYVYIQQLSEAVERLERLKSRETRPDQ